MTQVSLKMPTVPFGTHNISRLVVGGNQQSGVSHQSKEMTLHMLEHFTLDEIVKFLQHCVAQGINTWQANYSEKTRDAVNRIRQAGNELNLISLSAPVIADRDNGWAKLLDLKPIGIYTWGVWTDRAWREGKIESNLDFLKRIRQAGVKVGVGTHIPEVIEYMEEKGWDVDFYMACLYRWGKTKEEILKFMPEVPHDGYGGAELYMPSELARMCETIRKTKKMCLAFKLFAGGRTCNTPEKVSEVFQYVLGNIKPKDAVVVGMYPRFTDQIKENADLVKKFG